MLPASNRRGGEIMLPLVAVVCSSW